MTVEITQAMLDTFSNADFTGLGNADWEDSHIRAGLTAVLAMPEVRQAIHDDVSQEPAITRAFETLHDNGITAEQYAYYLTGRRAEDQA